MTKLMDETTVEPVATTPDLSDKIVYDRVCQESVDALLKYGVVAIKGVIPSVELEGVCRAVDTLYFESLHKRILFRLLEKVPNIRFNTWVHGKHSATSQFDPNKTPTRLASALPAIELLKELDKQFFEDKKLAYLYRNRPARLNIVDVSRSKPKQKAFEAHQDSASVTRLGHVIQPVDTRWKIHGGHEPSHTEHDYTFDAPKGSVVTTIERAGERPGDLKPGNGVTYFLKDGSEVHSGDNLTSEIRHRLAIFAAESTGVSEPKVLSGRAVELVVEIQSLLRGVEI